MPTFSKKYLISIMVVGMMMNGLLFFGCYKSGLPLWLDLTGTAYTAYLLGPVPGLIVGLINNLTLVAFFGFTSIPYYLISLAVALIVGYFGQRGTVRDFLSFCGLVSVIFWICTVLSLCISLVMDNAGSTNDYWGDQVYLALQAAVSPFWALTISIALLKLIDLFVGALVVWAALLLTPKAHSKTE